MLFGKKLPYLLLLALLKGQFSQIKLAFDSVWVKEDSIINV